MWEYYPQEEGGGQPLFGELEIWMYSEKPGNFRDNQERRSASFELLEVFFDREVGDQKPLKSSPTPLVVLEPSDEPTVFAVAQVQAIPVKICWIEVHFCIPHLTNWDHYPREGGGGQRSPDRSHHADSFTSKSSD